MLRYANGLKYEIQDEISMHLFQTVDEAYQVSLKVEKKIRIKQQQKLYGKILEGRGRASNDRDNEKEN